MEKDETSVSGENLYQVLVKYLSRRIKSRKSTLYCVIPYIHNSSDRNSFSLVCRKWYELDSITRKHVTVHLTYATTPSRLLQRFPFLESLTLKGGPSSLHYKFIHTAQWFQEIASSFIYLNCLSLCSLIAIDSDLELLAKKRGKKLRVLKIKACDGFSTDGLLHITKYGNYLRNLCIEDCTVEGNNRIWFHEFALGNTCIESLNIYYSSFEIDVLALLAKNCSRSLVSVKTHVGYNLRDLREFFNFADRLEDFGPIKFFYVSSEYAGFKFPPNLRRIAFHDMMESDFPVVLPFANRLTELNLMCSNWSLNEDDYCFLLQKCPNLEVLHMICLEDRVLQVIGQSCKKLCKFIVKGGTISSGSTGLMALVQGCPDLECLDIGVLDITNEAMECIGAHLKNLLDFRISLHHREERMTDQPLDNGVQTLLIGCSKLEKLGLCLQHGALTDVGLGYIGKYGCNLRSLFLGYTGESDAGIVELSKGCPKLRKLRMRCCPFSDKTVTNCVFNITPLRYMWVEDKSSRRIWKMNRNLKIIRPSYVSN